MTETKSIRAAINQLSPLWRIRQIETANGTSSEDISNIETRLGELCRKEATKLCQTVDIGGDNADWAESYFSSLIAGLIADKWTESPLEAEGFAYAEHLASLASEPMYAGLPSSWLGTNAEISYAATTLSSISRAMQSYAKFNLFHFDREVIQNYFIEQIITSAQEATMVVKPTLVDQTDINSSSSLYQTFIRQAGLAMSDLWEAASVKLISEYTNSNKSEQQHLQKPYDLNLISEQLRVSVVGLAEGVVASLQISQSFNHSNSHSLS